jgi:hypothetical protein
MSCTTDYIDSVPSMIVGFRSAEDAHQWLGPFAEHIGGPFCDAANRNGREARVYMTVGAGPQGQARKWSCELGKWGDWFAMAPENPESAPPQTIADAVAACNDVQANREVPVSCQSEYVDGVPSLIVGFPTAADAETYLAQVANQVAQPFCDAANRAGRRASFFITLASSQARQFDCEQQRWSEWFQLSRGERRARQSI